MTRLSLSSTTNLFSWSKICRLLTSKLINNDGDVREHSSCSEIYGSNIYIFGGSYGNTIYNLSLSFELTANNVLIYNANSNYSFDLITDQVTIPIKNIYIGDSNNTAQLANAYLYDESQTAWVNVNTGEVLTL